MGATAKTRAHVAAPSQPSNLNLNLENSSLDESATPNNPIVPTQPQSRREKRKAKKADITAPVSDTSDEPEIIIPVDEKEVVEAGEEELDLSDEEPIISKNKAKKLKKQQEKEARKADQAANSSTITAPTSEPIHKTTTTPLSRTLTPTMPPSPAPIPLFIASIGNPTAQYANTLHSTGHKVLQTLHSRLSRTSHMYPWLADRRLANGLTAAPDDRVRTYSLLQGFQRVPRDAVNAPHDFDWTLWQSPVLMNISGRAVSTAWKTWRQGKQAQIAKSSPPGSAAPVPQLVIVHDELEAALGEVKVRKQDASAKGHNGLKSIQASMPGEKYWRIGVGIGRPESRDPDQVARYVLRKMTYPEEAMIERATDFVFKELRDISDGTRK
jgi:PTH1 family peptidyl-tRNA hydrolase